MLTNMVGPSSSPVGPAPRSRLLRGNPALRALCASRAVSFVGDGIATTALVLLVAPRDGPAGVGVLLLANALPKLGGPLAGVLADRVQTRRLMRWCELASALVVGLLAATMAPLPLLAALVGVVSILSTIRNPAGRSLVPVLVAPADRAPANALFGVARTLTLTVGPGLGGLLAAGPGGAHTALAVDAATFVASALLLAGLPAIPPVRDPTAVDGVWAEAIEGLRYIAAHRQVLVLALSLFLLVAFAAVDNVALVFLTGEVLHVGSAGYGIASSAFGGGMLLAALACTRLARGRSPVTLLIVAVAATGAGTIVNGLAPVLAVVVAAQLVAGAGNAVENIGSTPLSKIWCLVRFLGGCSARSVRPRNSERLSPTPSEAFRSSCSEPAPPLSSPVPRRSWSCSCSCPRSAACATPP